MVRNKSVSTRVVAVLAVLFSLGSGAGCKSTPEPNSSAPSAPTATTALSGKTDDGSAVTVDPAAAGGGRGGTMLALPSRDQLKKNSIDSATMALLQIGSPESVREAVSRISSDSRGMTDQNRVALAVAGEIMRILYPLETVSWPTPSVPDGDNYLASIRSARLGAYDYSAGSSDFLSLVLPSFILAVTPLAGDWIADADAALERAAKLNEKSVLPPLFRGMIAERTGNAALAQAFFKRAWDLDGSCYPAGVSLSRQLTRSGKGEEGLRIARTLLARYPESLSMTRLCAEASFHIGRWDEADQYVLSVLKAEPNDAPYLLLRARILVERREYLKANSLLDAFATTNRTDKSYLLLRARVAREWNRNAISATAFLQEAIRLYPEDLDVLLATSEVAYQTGQQISQKTGRDLVLAALAKQPDNRQAVSLLVNDYISSQDWANAVRYGERLVSLDSSTVSRILMARAYLGAGNAGRAVVIGKTLYSENPASDEIVALYLSALVDTGDATGAHAVIAARLPSASSSLKSVLHYYESRFILDPEKRLSVLRSSLLADPRNPLALFAMYEWYFARNDYRKAQYYLKQVVALEPANRRYSQLLANLDELLAR